MGLLDDINKINIIPNHKWTLKEFLKVEKKLLKKGQKSIIKELIKNENKNNSIVKFTNNDKPIVDLKRVNKYYKK